MSGNEKISRRIAVRSSIFGALTVAVPNLVYARELTVVDDVIAEIPKRYPAIEDSIVAEVVGVAHFNLDRLKELVEARPELARATWDWGFGDWESALGAASHVGRKDIVDYLMLKGARPDIFTYAMLGSYSVVKAMIDLSPGVQRIAGPHGISLLQHVKNGALEKSNDPERNKLTGYLESLGDADGRTYLAMEENDKPKYLGDYRYGEGEGEGFSVKMNMRKLITLGRLGQNGGALYRLGENQFTYNGAPSVLISFSIEDGRVKSLTVTEPNLILTAKKIA